MRYVPGLRAKFNAIVLPVLALVFTTVVAVDYRHEVRTVMAAHAIHEASRDVHRYGPIDPATTPEAAGRATLFTHAAFGLVTFTAVLIATNVALSVFVLAPLARVRAACRQMERGHWRVAGLAEAGDEVGLTTAAFRQLGLSLGAFVGHTLQTERLATLALVAQTTAGAIEPEVSRLGASVGRLHASPAPGVRQEAEEVASAAAAILAAVRRLGHTFDGSQRTRGGTRR